MSRYVRSALVWGLALVLASGLAWWLQGGAGTRADAAPSSRAATTQTPTVEVAPVRVATLDEAIRAVGSLQSRQRVDIRPQQEGRVVAIGFRDGERVRAGQVLFRLDDAVQAAEVQRARAQQALAQTQLRRTEDLLARQFVSLASVDDAQVRLQVAQADLALAQARLDRMTLRAPFDAQAGLRQVDLGAYVAQGAALVALEDTSTLLVSFAVPERYRAALRLGQAVALEVDALPGQTFAAAIDSLDAQLDQADRALTVRARLAPTQAIELLQPGMSARLRLVLSRQEGALLIPEAALVPEAERQTVFRLDRPGPGSEVARVERVSVTTGLRQAGEVQILSGLRPQDVVVVAGQQRLRGASVEVRVVDFDREAPPAAPGRPG